MKSAEDRDAMVARVKKFSDQYPSLQSAPEASGPISVEVKGSRDQQAYVAALYEVAEKGEPVGRDKSGTMLFGGELKKAASK